MDGNIGGVIWHRIVNAVNLNEGDSRRFQYITRGTASHVRVYYFSMALQRYNNSIVKKAAQGLQERAARRGRGSVGRSSQL